MAYPRDQQIDALLRRHLPEMELDRENDASATVHSPEEHPNAIRGLVRCPFLTDFCWEAALPQQQFPVYRPALDPERCLEDTAVRVIAVHVVELKVVAWNELVMDCGSRECGVVAAHTHQFILVAHAVSWVRDDNLFAAEEERIDFLACGSHHGRLPIVLGDIWDSYEVVSLDVGN